MASERKLKNAEKRNKRTLSPKEDAELRSEKDEDPGGEEGRRSGRKESRAGGETGGEDQKEGERERERAQRTRCGHEEKDGMDAEEQEGESKMGGGGDGMA